MRDSWTSGREGTGVEGKGEGPGVGKEISVRGLDGVQDTNGDGEIRFRGNHVCADVYRKFI